jgi:mRNA-degrading endonuclease toxin of MazEF toxin-antitoxin module
MKRGEIWLVDLDPTQGHEQRGRRPVLIVSPEAFNRVTKVPVVLPITSRGRFARTGGFAVTLDGAGTKTRGTIRCNQPRALDLSARAAARSWNGYRTRSWMRYSRNCRRFSNNLECLDRTRSVPKGWPRFCEVALLLAKSSSWTFLGHHTQFSGWVLVRASAA